MDTVRAGRADILLPGVIGVAEGSVEVDNGFNGSQLTEYPAVERLPLTLTILVRPDNPRDARDIGTEENAHASRV